jgi:hypothetical protein
VIKAGSKARTTVPVHVGDALASEIPRQVVILWAPASGIRPLSF